ncbi:DNA polymerase III subunit chi [Pontixanthobacter gangjinensis]|uniref:DNA polymerase III subunit chi n=1 Tax=Pontixanthobacter gangjinensis TaxID=1028742 RepID=A0A6I4SSR2_9SPHN|nr:DNA polymerase III subunit chi [Pontixanthobacter gangjinensis]MXO57552.1 DNA polymerase III subunit chi [Pontixanthobacter gangjinensis]
MKVDFWQLSRDPADRVVAMIAQRVLGSGQRLLVVSEDPAQLDQIGKTLWNTAPAEFLANGKAAATGAERQPILLSPECGAANGASHVIFADGIWREDASKFERSFLLFGESTLEQARACWRSLDNSDGLERSFFRQDEGKWVKVA